MYVAAQCRICELYTECYLSRTSYMSANLPPSTRVLQCRDLLVEIFGHLSPELLPPRTGFLRPGQRQNLHRDTLASSARVCKAFLDPALDVLWHTLDDVSTLLELVPSFETYVRDSKYLSVSHHVHMSYLTVAQTQSSSR